MFGKRWTLFKVAGIAIRIDASWLFLAVLITWTLAAGVFPIRYRNLPPSMYWGMGVAGAVGLFLSILVHELSHALTARRSGVRMNGITLFIFGGVAEMEEEPSDARSELFIALAGPAATVVVVLILLGTAFLLRGVGSPVPIVGVVDYLATLNVVLLVFNLIPAFPLDGGRVLRAILWRRKQNERWATQVASKTGSIFGAFLIALGVLRIILGDFIGGMWLALIGSFLRNAAVMSYQQIVLREALRGAPVRNFMKSDVVTVPRSTSMADLVENYFYKHHFRMFPVVDDGRLVGCVTTREVASVPRDEWDRVTVGAIAADCTAANTISPDADTLDALTQMNRTRSSRLLVMEGERLVGILTLKDLLRFLAVKIELEPG
jgi:Zn-dependent protease/predicted transcriptional regulator